MLQINIKTKEEAFAANIDLESINCVKFDSETTNPKKNGSKIRALALQFHRTRIIVTIISKHMQD